MNRRIVCMLVALWAAVTAVQAQPYMTRSGQVEFFSSTPLEDIRARNNQVYAIVDPARGSMAFSLLMKGFVFDKQLMQEHFNENYVESDKYPKASFTGQFTPLSGAVGKNTVQVSGTLTLHGVSRPLSVPAELEFRQGRLVGEARFTVKPADFQIKIPNLVKDKIASAVTVTVKVDLKNQ